MVAINAREIYRFEARPFKRFLCKVLVRRDFVIRESFPIGRQKISFKKTRIHFGEQLISFERAKYFDFVLDALKYCGQMLSSYNKAQFLLVSKVEL